MSEKYKRVRYLVTSLLMLAAVLFPVSISSLASAACAGKTVKLAHGTRCVKDGSVTCDKGYVAQYNGTSLDCLKEAGGSTGGGSGDTVGGNCMDISKCDLMSKYAYPFINFLAALVGLVVVISIIIGGIQYGSSAGDPQAAAAARKRIQNAIIALVTFIFLYALLNFLIPGGIFNS